jgi:hypothetical protein
MGCSKALPFLWLSLRNKWSPWHGFEPATTPLKGEHSDRTELHGDKMVDAAGIEPATYRLRAGCCYRTELRVHLKIDGRG